MSWQPLRRWFMSSARSTSIRRRPRPRLALEHLEDRLCPSNITITVQPTSQIAPVNSKVTLTAEAVGSPTPTVQWQFSVDQGHTFFNLSGGTHDQLVFNAPSKPVVDMFRAVFTNSSGSLDTNTVSVAVAVAPTTGTSPLSQTVDAGTPVTFTAAGNGTPAPNVQWQISSDSGKNFSNIPLADTGTLTFTARAGQNGDEFRAAFINAVGTAYSSAATLTVDFAPAVVTQPSSQTVATGSTVKLSAAASGNPTPGVVWQVSTDNGVTYADIRGATLSTYTFTAPTTPGVNLYRAEFTNTLGTASTKPATVTFDGAPAITANPLSETTNAGKLVTLTAAASGEPAPRVQWQISTDDGKTFTNIPPGTSNSITFAALSWMNGAEFHAVFTNAVGTATTTNATLTVDYAPGQLSPIATITVPTDAQVTLTTTATGNPVPTVQWQASLDGKHFSNLPGATSFSYVFVAPASATVLYFQAVFTNALGTSTSPVYTVDVDVPPTVTTNPASATVNAGSPVTFTAAASGTPAPQVQWQVSSDDGKTFSNLALANTPTLTFTARANQDGDEYRAVFTNGGGHANSSAATLTVDSRPSIVTQPVSETVAINSQATVSAAAAGDPTPTVVWQISTDGGHTYSDIATATLNTYTFTAPATPGVVYYRAVYTNALGTATTQAARVTVGIAPAATVDPLSRTVNAGTPVTFTAAATGTPAPRVQWQVSTDHGKTFSNIPLATTTTLTFKTASSENGDEFQAVFTNGAGTATTTAATLTVDFAPSITTQPQSQTVAVGNLVTLSAAAAGSPTPMVQWQVSTDGTNFSNIAGATADTYGFVAGSSPGTKFYRAVFKNALGKAHSLDATVTVVAAA